MAHLSRRRALAPYVSLAGLLLLSFLLGAAVVHFKLPGSQFLRESFLGGEAWLERRHELAASAEPGPPASADVDHPEKTFDGFTAYTTDVGAEALLINMRGDVVHRWAAPFSRVWPQATHVRNVVDDARIDFAGCHLEPNGDLLAVYEGADDTPYGYGLVKLDKDSNVLWSYAGNAHHTVDVGPDGTIYVLTQRVAAEMPRGLEYFPAPALVDSLVLLSPEGKERKTIPLLEALRDSPFAALLWSGARGLGPAWDALHANAVAVLPPSLAAHFPLFKAGQVLVSLRQLDALAVVDPDSGSVVWAARGPWRGQHDPHFLDTGRLLLFDNNGSTLGSRVLEYDPGTQACPWSYPGEGVPSFFSPIQGRAQRLPNGNTLIADSHDGVLLEVTPDRELVWSHGCAAHVPWARRYGPGQLTFLEESQHVRP